MWKLGNKISSLYIIFFFCAIACNPIVEIDESEKIPFSLPDYLGEIKGNYPTTNPITIGGIELGNILFHDKNLSQNKKVSCASCHEKQLAFSDGLALSTNGVSGHSLERNSPALFNLAWYNSYFWEGGAKNLSSQFFGPLTHPDEMNANIDSVIQYLKSSDTYPNLFKNAFGSDSIYSQKIAFAIEQFELSLISNHSKYDDIQNGKTDFTLAEKSGYLIYQKNCAACHTEGPFSDALFHNNGLDSVFNYEFEDPRLGRFRISNDSIDLGKYRTPSLRNLSFTAPYMHDGRLATINDVLNHYNSIDEQDSKIDLLLKRKITLSAIEKIELQEFLKTLDDYVFIQ